jgi:hypothetical protein
MADWGGDQGQAQGKVRTWDVAEQRRRARVWTGTLAEFGRAAAGRLHDWAIADTGPGHLLCCRGCRSPSASASRSISPPAMSRPGGRAPGWRRPAALLPFSRGLGRSPFRLGLPAPRSRAALRSRRSPPCRCRIRFWRARPATSPSRASSRFARSESALTASWCGCSRSRPPGCRRSSTRCASRSRRAPRPWLAHTSRSAPA